MDKFHIKYFTKTEPINPKIDNALKSAPSKSGGDGNNFPDIKIFIPNENIPVMIEVKGTKGDLVKFDSNGNIDNINKKGQPNFNNIKKYAVNGAVHYANAIIEYSQSYKSVIAIGVNGYEEDGNIKTEYGVYWVSDDNYKIPKKYPNI